MNHDAQQSSDHNVDELRRLSNPAELGDMLRLATEIELVRDSDVEPHKNLWAYLRSKGFEPFFVERVARAYWNKACDVIEQIPYRGVVTGPGSTSHRQLAAHLLREVCHEMTRET